jgi:hypothetical protein
MEDVGDLRVLRFEFLQVLGVVRASPHMEGAGRKAVLKRGEGRRRGASRCET